MADEQRPEEVQRWTAKRRAALVISLLKGETTVAEAARRHGLKVAEVEEWRDRFLLAAENGLRARPKEDEALREEMVNRLKRKVGELTMDLDILREAARLRRRGRPTSDDDVARRIDTQSVSSSEVFPCPAAGARGKREGSAAPALDRTASDVWLSAAVGIAAFW
jgi:transposase-like protein